MSTIHGRPGVPPDRARARDVGVSLIEVLLAVVLMGTVVTGTLTALRSAVSASSVQRDHATAHAWLQSAADALYATDKVSCDPLAPDHGASNTSAAYEALVRSVTNPERWEATQIRVADVAFWNAIPIGNGRTAYTFGALCHETLGLGLQLVEIEVRSPSGRILEQVQIVKS